MVLDFKEIPEARGGSGLQDAFELFAREFLMYKGYNIIENPDRGADGKRDLIVEEVKRGISSDIKVKWLVSCKHYAHSGNAVKDSDEIDITDRLMRHGCDGFMGIYSTIPASSLAGKVNSMGNKAFVYDRESLERELLSDLEGLKLVFRFFPESYKKFIEENPERVDIFDVKEPIRCEYCKKELINWRECGNYLLLKKMYGKEDDYDENRVDKIVFCCKSCDDVVIGKYRREGYYDFGWDDLKDLRIPSIWLTRFIAFLNNLRGGMEFSNEAYGQMKRMFVESYPFVIRKLTSEEKATIDAYMMFGYYL